MPDPDVDAVLAANAAFYAAFEAGDLEAMADVWDRSDRASVTHPGWPTLQGWARVVGSWNAIFANTPYIQFVCTDETVRVVGDVAWVTLDENIIQAVGLPGADDRPAGDGSDLAGSRIASCNVFVREGGRWRMVLHHGSPVGAG